MTFKWVSLYFCFEEVEENLNFYILSSIYVFTWFMWHFEGSYIFIEFSVYLFRGGEFLYLYSPDVVDRYYIPKLGI